MRPFVKWTATAGALLLPLAACATAEFEAPDDPVEEVRLRLDEFAAVPAEVGVCAGERVERDRRFLFVASRGPQQLLGAERRPTDRRIRSDERNLSQASADAANVVLAKQMSEAAQARDIHGAVKVRVANFSLDDIPGGSEPGRILSAPRVYFAAAGSAYHDPESSAEDRAAVLDWMTANALRDPELLRAYHRAFVQAAKGPCS